MRDLKLIAPDDGSYNLDFDIVDGFPEYVTYPQQTQDQRAAISAYMIRGTIPGKPDTDVNWSGLYDKDDETLISIDNEVKQAIQKNAAIPGNVAGMYIPIYTRSEEGGVKINIFQS